MVVFFGDWSVESGSFPLDLALEDGSLHPGSVGDEPVFVLEGPHWLFVDISSREAEIG